MTEDKIGSSNTGMNFIGYNLGLDDNITKMVKF